MAEVKKLLAKDLRKLSVKELVDLRKKLRKELFSLKLKNQAWALKQTHIIPLTRRNIARVNTVLTEKIKENYPDQAKKK